MSNDLLMLRGEQDGTYNLAVGEPVFLQVSAFWCNPRSMLQADPRYPSFGGDAHLIELVRKNIKFCKKHVVITCGAKQALLAAFHAYNTRAFEPKTMVQHLAPYWPSYPTLAKMTPGMTFTSIKDLGKVNGWSREVKVITSPNNPDGSESLGDCHIWDGAYAHSVYGHAVTPKFEVGVFSAAKLLGLSGIRVGILTTDDDELAQLAREYVEKTTSGVPNDSQARLIDVFDAIGEAPDRAAADYMAARHILLTNREAFSNHLGPFCSEIRGAPASGKGMFAWFKADHKIMTEALQTSKVKVIPGKACGVDVDQNGMGWFRMSMGHRIDYTERALVELSSHLDRKL